MAELERGRPVALQLEGEPGIGKTRLLTELGLRADRRGWLVRSGSAADLEGELPFAVFVDALDEYLRSLAPHELADLDADALGELAQVFPALSGVDRARPGDRYRTQGDPEALAVLREAGEVAAVRDPATAARLIDGARRLLATAAPGRSGSRSSTPSPTPTWAPGSSGWIPRSCAMCAIGRSPSNARRTPRWRSSSGYFFGLAMRSRGSPLARTPSWLQGLRRTRDGSVGFVTVWVWSARAVCGCGELTSRAVACA